jgi:hypothetical protein
LPQSSLIVKLKGKPAPPALSSPFLADVSHEYFPHVNITVELSGKPEKGEILYLDVFDGREWMPMGWTEAVGRKKRVRFCHVEPAILYRVSAIRMNEQIPLTEPFILKGNENAHYLRADTALLQELKLTRKFRTTHVWPDRLGKAIGGKFQGACRADFADAVTLYEIVDTVSLGMMAFPVHHTEKFKYVRYVTPESSGNSIAELWFLSKGDPLRGKIICSAGQEGQVKEQIADDNPVSRFNLERPGSWIGFAFKKPEQITGIRFQYWNDDNSIRKNDEYELYYWANGKWNSLGRQTGHDLSVLEYKNCPTGALFQLHDHTRGREERPFTYENGKQVWW